MAPNTQPGHADRTRAGAARVLERLQEEDEARRAEATAYAGDFMDNWRAFFVQIGDAR